MLILGIILTLVYRYADLNKFPQIRKLDSKHLSLGDLHGNALKLIYILIEEGILELNDEEYKHLATIYHTATDELTAEQLNTFKSIIAQAKVNKDKAITLIGDELADRGSNDYFTLLVLKKLHDSKISWNVLLSNHSAEFIKDYEREHFTGKTRLNSGFSQSLTNMHSLIAKGLIKEEEVRAIVEDCYIPKTKAISYTVSSEGELTLFTHAPVGLETVQGLANKFNIPYKDESIKELIQTIDKINQKVEYHFRNKELGQLIQSEGHASSSRPINPKKRPLKRLFWNRVVGEELVTETSTGIKVKFVHGHIGDGQLLKLGQLLLSHENLDNLWGKTPEWFKTARYHCLDEDGEVQKISIVEHFTRHSHDLTSIKLINFLWDLKSAHQQFRVLCEHLKKKTDTLITKGTKEEPLFNVRYQKVAVAAQKLHHDLLKAEETFFSQTPSKESINDFAQSIQSSVKTANTEFIKHRGIWYGEGNSLVNFLKGVLQIIENILLFIPNQINKILGYSSYSFLKKPATKSSEQLTIFEKDFNYLIKEIETKVFSEKEEQAEDEEEEINFSSSYYFREPTC